MHTVSSGTNGIVGRNPAPEAHLDISGSTILAHAERLVETFEERLAGVAYGGRGIPMSEMFFLFAAVAPLRPRRILASGRGWGQSTLVLGHAFPEAEIISVEFDRDTPAANTARKRVAHLANVQCLFGDSRQLLPARLEPGCVVLIDGPKEFRALKLALRLLRTGRPAAVFLHDFHRRSPARRWAERHLPHALASDAPEWVRRYARLDPGFTPKRDWLDEPPAQGSGGEANAGGFRGYGPTLLCVPALPPGLRCGRLLARLTLHRHLTRVRERLWRGRQSLCSFS